MSQTPAPGSESRPVFGWRRWAALGLAAFLILVTAALFVWREDILQAALDPQEPFQTYRPPPEPDYSRRDAWWLIPTAATPAPDAPPADVFFVAPTTFDGGENWNSPIDDGGSDRFFRGSVAPNYVGPFLRTGRIFAPRYRQASLYSQLTLREDAREARRFAYGDVAKAFRWFVARYNGGRPFILVGVEQGGVLAQRLMSEEIAPNPALRGRLVAAYLVETLTPAAGQPLPPCVRRSQAGCLAAWATAVEGDLTRPRALRERSLTWDAAGQLVNLEGRAPLCFNPLKGAVTNTPALARLNLGAVNATGLEWGARPALMARQVGARCERGVLIVTRPKSASLRPSGGWAERQKVGGYNYFYGDLEADAAARLAAWRVRAAAAQPAP